MAAKQINKAGGRAWRLLRAAFVALALLLVIGLAVLLWARHQLRGSLPVLDGKVVLGGLTSPVRVERDRLGVPTIAGTTRPDVARVLGFVHAQDRFFQMDLLRRRAAGELAELLGETAVGWDERIRRHRLRAAARRAVAAGRDGDRRLLEAYTAGVNSGLAALGSAPFEYRLFGSRPEPWIPEDSVLVLHAMYAVLNPWSGRPERSLGALHELLPPELAAFLDCPGSEWDAPLVGEAFEVPPIPGPEVVDLRARLATMTPEDAGAQEAAAEIGSNNWALAGSHSSHGGALLANDMHLGLAIPNIWYRAALEFPDAAGSRLRIVGVSLPGSPLLVAGSTGRIAWGFTYTYGDFVDVVLVEPDREDPGRYLTPDGPRAFERFRETIKVRGGEARELEVPWTIWGPVVGSDREDRPVVVRWVAHDPDAVDLELQLLEQARTVDEALDVAARSGIPGQNFVCADAAGRIGWTVMGRFPKRFGFDGRTPTSWADGSRGWQGWLEAEDYPRIVDPPSGRLWTANSRTVEGERLPLIGDGGYALGARARQIRDALAPLESATERDLLAIQLDDRALFLERWQRLLVEALDARSVAADPRRGEMRRLAEAWGGRAAIESVGYRLVRAFRIEVMRRAIEPLLEPCKGADPPCSLWDLTRVEGPLWRLLSERPEHLLDPGYGSWDELLLAAADAVLDRMTEDGAVLADRSWGERNALEMGHPLGRALPVLGRWLDMPSIQLPGDTHMPRVQSPVKGASQRMVVSPGREEHGIFHMPGGQSGHPLSPYYRAGHEAWARGEPSPFLPGQAEHVLELVPAIGR